MITLRLDIGKDYDFTPTGKRTVRVVRWNQIRGHRVTVIQGYVSGRKYIRFATLADAITWRDNTTNLLPQEWSAL